MIPQDIFGISHRILQKLNKQNENPKKRLVLEFEAQWTRLSTWHGETCRVELVEGALCVRQNAGQTSAVLTDFLSRPDLPQWPRTEP